MRSCAGQLCLCLFTAGVCFLILRLFYTYEGHVGGRYLHERMSAHFHRCGMGAEGGDWARCSQTGFGGQLPARARVMCTGSGERRVGMEHVRIGISSGGQQPGARGRAERGTGQPEGGGAGRADRACRRLAGIESPPCACQARKTLIGHGELWRGADDGLCPSPGTQRYGRRRRSPARRPARACACRRDVPHRAGQALPPRPRQDVPVQGLRRLSHGVQQKRTPCQAHPVRTSSPPAPTPAHAPSPASTPASARSPATATSSSPASTTSASTPRPSTPTRLSRTSA
jgi:hypothetical protein